MIYVVKGRARMRWGEQLEFIAEAGPGDFIYVPPYVPHQEINASDNEPLECVLVRSDNEAVAINIDIEPVEKPETVYWVDPTRIRTSIRARYTRGGRSAFRGARARAAQKRHGHSEWRPGAPIRRARTKLTDRPSGASPARLGPFRR